MDADSPSERFLGLDHVHEALNDLFCGHQEALILRDFPIAVDLLETFDLLLRIHMRHEEELLLPIYDARCDRKMPAGGCGTKDFVLEHKRMLELLKDIQVRMRDLATRCRCRTAPRDIIALLDQECTFKHLVQHHNMREHSDLYPGVDDLASEGERVKLMKLCSEDWWASFRKSL